MGVTTMAKDKMLFMTLLSYVKRFQDDKRHFLHAPTELASVSVD